MTHAFFKALLFLCSGSVIHAMAGEQDMQRMGGLKKYMPVTYTTMMIGTLAIAGIPPLAGFFSKDDILLNAFLGNKAVWIIAVVTALMTAFYMFRLMSLTFFGEYRGPAWAHAGQHVAVSPHGHALDVREAAAHGAAHPHDMAAHGHAHQEDHEVTHGKADSMSVHPVPHGSPIADHGSAGHGHGHGAWHGPHESPAAMTRPLMALAVGAIVAGFVGIPEALGSSGNAIAAFLAPSFEGAVHEPHHVSHATEWLLMAFSVGIGALGIFLAYRFYVTDPAISRRLAGRFAGVHRVLLNKYYVDEAYDATVIRGTLSSAVGLWGVDRHVVDGAVNGAGKLTVITSWFSGLTDRSVVDGLVNAVGRVIQEASFTFRRFQTGLIQNYALLMLFGVFAFITIYLVAR
jgi:NADH:ubiquinone oxidoreductase subunit 5 (subunit L)/multisubunit Na+/H+ antiporter MnhA subunit